MPQQDNRVDRDTILGTLADIERTDPVDLRKLLELSGATREQFASLIPEFPDEEQGALATAMFCDELIRGRLAPQLLRWKDLKKKDRGELLARAYDIATGQADRSTTDGPMVQDQPDKQGREAASTSHARPCLQRTNALYEAVWKAIDGAFGDLHEEIHTGDKCPWYVNTRKKDDPHTAVLSLEDLFHETLASWDRPDQKHLVLLYGATGHGKSCFVTHYYRSHLQQHRPEEANNTFFVRVHLSSASLTEDFEEDVDHQISAEISAQFPWMENKEYVLKVWETIYPFDRDFQQMLVRAEYPLLGSDEAKLRWINSRYAPRPGDRHTTTRHSDWNRARINFLVQRGVRVVLFFDNFDQADREIQLLAFRMARHKLEWLPVNACTAIVAVRDYFVNRALSELETEAKECQRFYVPPPDLAEVVRRRSEVAADNCVRKYGASQFTLRLHEGRTSSFSFTVTDIKRFFDQAFRCFESQDVCALLNVISNQNVRFVLGMIHMVMSSPLLTDDRIIDFLEKRHRMPSLLASHEVLHCLLASDPKRHFFSPNESPLLNLYSIGEDRHFGNCLIQLQILMIFEHQRWIGVEDLMEMFTALGYYREMIRIALQQLLHARLLYSEDGVSLANDRMQRVERTAAGAAYFSDVARRLYYLQLVAYDVPDMNDELKCRLPRSQERESSESRLLDRIKSAVLLYHHMNLAEDKQQEYVAALPESQRRVCSRLAPSVRKRIREEAARIVEGDPKRLKEVDGCLDDYKQLAPVG